MGDYASDEDESTLWPFKINTLLKRNNAEDHPNDAKRAGKPAHKLVKVFTVELIGLHAKKEMKKYLEEVYHSPDKVAPRGQSSSGQAQARSTGQEDNDENTFSNRGGPPARSRSRPRTDDDEGSQEAPIEEDSVFLSDGAVSV
jgi:hypothetical protein